MRAAAGGVVDANHDLPGKQVLHAEIPLIDFRVASSPCVQAVVVRFTIKCEGAGRFPLRERKAVGKRIGQRGQPRLKIVRRHNYVVRVAKSSADKLEIRGDVQTVINTGASANYRLRIHGIGEAEAWSDVIAVDRNIAVSGTCKNRGANQIAGARQQILHSGVRRRNGVRQRNAAVTGEIAELNLVVALVVRSAPFVAQTEIHSQLRIDFPIVLKIESGFLGLVGDGRRNGQMGIKIGVTEQEARKRVSLERIACTDDLFGNALREMKKAAGILRLRKIVVEEPLLEAELPYLAAFYPCDRGTVRTERVRETRIGAALVEKRSCVVVHLNRGKARGAVGLGQDLIARLIEDCGNLWIVFRNRRDRAIQRCAIRPDDRGRKTPVVFERSVVDIGGAVESVVEVAVAEDGWNRIDVVKIAVARGEPVSVREMMIDLDIELVAGCFGKNRLVIVRYACAGVLHGGHRI